MLQFTPTMLQRGGECTNRRILEAEKTEFQPSTPFDFYELTVSKEIPLQGHFLTNPENVPPQILNFDKGSSNAGGKTERF